VEQREQFASIVTFFGAFFFLNSEMSHPIKVVAVIAIAGEHVWFLVWWIYIMYLGFKRFKDEFRRKSQTTKENVEEEEKKEAEKGKKKKKKVAIADKTMINKSNCPKFEKSDHTEMDQNWTTLPCSNKHRIKREMKNPTIIH